MYMFRDEVVIILHNTVECVQSTMQFACIPHAYSNLVSIFCLHVFIRDNKCWFFVGMAQKYNMTPVCGLATLPITWHGKLSNSSVVFLGTLALCQSLVWLINKHGSISSIIIYIFFHVCYSNVISVTEPLTSSTS